MTDYRTGGTPWTVIMGAGPERTVLANGFQIDAHAAIDLIETQLAGVAAEPAGGRPR